VTATRERMLEAGLKRQSGGTSGSLKAAFQASARSGVEGTCRRKALRAWKASRVGAWQVERVLAPLGDPGAVRGNGVARQEVSEATCPRLTCDSTGWRESRSGKPSTLRGRVGMVSAKSTAPTVLLLEAG